MSKKYLPLLFLAPLALAATAAAWSAFSVKTREGSVDWTAGVIHARGEWKLKNVKDGEERVMAERGATMKAQRNALSLMQNISIDGDTAVGDDPNLVQVISINGTLRGGRVMDTKVEDGYLIVEVDAPLAGNEGVIKTVATDFRDKYLPPPAPMEPEPAVTAASSAAASAPAPDSAPGSVSSAAPAASAPAEPSSAPQPRAKPERLVIDARGSGARPALLPKVKSSQGAPVYTASNVAYDDLLSGGQVKYVTAARGAAQAPFSRGGLLALLTGNPPRAPKAAPSGMVRVIRSEGSRKGDLVLAPGEEKKLQTPEARAAMRSGQVLIVMDNSAGGVEGWRWTPGVAELASR